MPTPLTLFDGGCLYLTKYLSEVCRRQERFCIADMALRSKVKAKYLNLFAYLVTKIYNNLMEVAHILRTGFDC